ncbi:MAG: phosphoribosyltransferase family protein [Opitutus sp.]
MISTNSELIRLLAGRRGHFAMESGYHSEWWFELGRLFDEPKSLKPYVSQLAQRIAQARVEVICGPQVGGAKLARLIAEELRMPYFFTERFESPAATGFFPVKYLVPMEQRASLRGKTVAIVDDAVSAGSAARGTYADLVECGAEPTVLAALFVFGPAAAAFAQLTGMILEGLATLPLGIWRPGECPHCAAGEPIERVSDAI